MAALMMKKIWPIVKAYAPVSTLPIFVFTCVYLDWARTQKYKKQKELESLGLQREFDRKINL